MILRTYWRKTPDATVAHLVGDSREESRTAALCGVWPRYPEDEPWTVAPVGAVPCRVCLKAVDRHFPGQRKVVSPYPISQEKPF